MRRPVVVNGPPDAPVWKKRGRRPLAASVVRLEIRVPKLLAQMAEERAASRGIKTAELWREAMHALLGAPKAAE